MKFLDLVFSFPENLAIIWEKNFSVFFLSLLSCRGISRLAEQIRVNGVNTRHSICVIDVYIRACVYIPMHSWWLVLVLDQLIRML